MNKFLVVLFLLVWSPSNCQSISSKRIEKLNKAVVRILVNNSSFGTGFFISPNGLLATANHVVQPAFIRDKKTNSVIGVKSIKIEFKDGEIMEMGVVDSFLGNSYMEGLTGDFILLAPKKETPRKFEYLKLGVWDDVKEGETVYTAGFPFGIKQRVITVGILSTKYKRQVPTFNKGERSLHNRDAAWLDMTLNAGNSGGPIIKMGRNAKKDVVVGIASFNLNPYAQRSQRFSRMYLNISKGLKPNQINSDRALGFLFESVAQNSLGISGAVTIDFLALRLRQQNLVRQDLN
jgi:S1-C subfamily serine protease